jgi:hypothetical protein
MTAPRPVPVYKAEDERAALLQGAGRLGQEPADILDQLQDEDDQRKIERPGLEGKRIPVSLDNLDASPPGHVQAVPRQVEPELDGERSGEAPGPDADLGTGPARHGHLHGGELRSVECGMGIIPFVIGLHTRVEIPDEVAALCVPSAHVFR